MGLPSTTVAPDNQPAWDMSSLKVSSDAMHSLDHGASAHADFMSGWTKAQIQQLLVDCYYSSPPNPNYTNRNPRNCGHIGNP